MCLKLCWPNINIFTQYVQRETCIIFLIIEYIEEGCALVPPRQFIRTSGGLEKAMLQRYDSGREHMKVGFACDSERHVQKDILLWSAMWLRCAGQTYS